METPLANSWIFVKQLLWIKSLTINIRYLMALPITELDIIFASFVFPARNALAQVSSIYLLSLISRSQHLYKKTIAEALYHILSQRWLIEEGIFEKHIIEIHASPIILSKFYSQTELNEALLSINTFAVTQAYAICFSPYDFVRRFTTL
ncbi:hypothetical protein X798_04094 [Onchocerca flexuosa]|uniref:Uncharacterized protein n=1 Tax=Onchocerca flexuosa TaxID=387005 RepID=A0A238BUB1_9BILA|nr:hypothetical protein X798_04094 [Onchocerca flexuosa]